MKATCIKWVTDEEEVNNLPQEIELPVELTNEEIDYEGIDDYLSDMTGFLHEGYVLED